MWETRPKKLVQARRQRAPNRNLRKINPQQATQPAAPGVLLPQQSTIVCIYLWLSAVELWRSDLHSQATRVMSELSSFFISLGTSLIAQYHQLENLLVETGLMELNTNLWRIIYQTLAKTQEINTCWMDSPDRLLDEGVLSLLDDHQSSIYCWLQAKWRTCSVEEPSSSKFFSMEQKRTEPIN